MNTLEKQLEKYKKEIHSDEYPMSIGECVNMYINGELDIQPEFQRFYRWTLGQKSKFIESILLGIPIPSFFVAQRQDGVWDLVDGLQRFSTILSFMGELKGPDGKLLPPLKLSSGVYLTELDGIRWKDEGTFTKSLQLSFRREKLDFKIIKKESTADTKYELFRRLNTGGSELSGQEVRNCLLLMANKIFFDWILRLSQNKHFTGSVSLSLDQYEKQFNTELVVRFIVFTNLKWGSVKSTDIADLGEFLNEKIIELAQDDSFDFNEQERIFNDTFELIENALGDDAFKKYYPDEQRHKGAFSIALYEAITTGIALNIGKVRNNYSKATLKEAIIAFAQTDLFIQNSGAGVSASSRTPKIVPHAIDFFAK